MAAEAEAAVGGVERGVVERAGWAVLPSSSRRFFLVVALIVAGCVLLASTIATTVVLRNAAAVADARGRGLRVASSVMEFRSHLSLADAELATTMVTGQNMSPLGRARYERELFQASLSLTDAGLAADGRNARRIALLAEDLARYAELVETSRAYPVGSTFHDLARTTVREDLVPRAGRARRAAEREVTDAAARVTDPFTTLAVAGLTSAVAVQLVSVLLVAGRTRIRLHFLLVGAAAALLVDLAFTGESLWSQRNDFGAAAAEEVEAFVDANVAAFALFDARSAETDALSSEDAAAAEDFFTRFHDDASSLVGRLGADGRTDESLATLQPEVQTYVNSVVDVESLDGEGNHAGAVEAAVDGESAITYRNARALATSIVNRSTADLRARLATIDEAGAPWWIPVGLGVCAAALAAAGVLRRGWDYF